MSCWCITIINKTIPESPFSPHKDEKGAYRIIGAVRISSSKGYIWLTVLQLRGLEWVGVIPFGRYNELINNILKTNK